MTALRRPELDVIDAALLVLEAVERVQRGVRHDRVAGQRAEQLLAQRDAPLLRHEPLLGVAGVAQHRLEAHAVELAGDAFEGRILGHPARDLGIGHTEPQRPRPIVERGFGDDLAEQLPIEAGGPRLVGQDGAVQLAAELLQPVLVELAERVHADFGAADLGNGGLAESAEDIADTPDAEADGNEAQDHAHDDAADPIGGGFVDTSEHENRSFCWVSGRFRADWPGI